MRKEIHQYVTARDWGGVFACLSPLEQRAAFVVARYDKTAASAIVSKCFCSRPAADRALADLCTVNLVESLPREERATLFRIKDSSFGGYCRKVDKFKLWEGADNDLANELYTYLSNQFGALEQLGLIYGNSHHMAQKLSSAVREDLKSRWAEEKK